MPNEHMCEIEPKSTALQSGLDGDIQPNGK